MVPFRNLGTVIDSDGAITDALHVYPTNECPDQTADFRPTYAPIRLRDF